MREIALQSILDNNLLQKGDSVTLAVSGGADSVALCCFMNEIAPEFELDLKVCHFNHGIRGENSDRDEEFVRNLAEKLGLRFVTEKKDVPSYSKKNGISVEMAARELRYDFLNRQTDFRGKIATAHHADDQLETVLLNLTRGSGLRGMTGIPIRRDNLIRPLLRCSKEDILQYLKDIGQDYCTDETNFLDDYARNKIRHHVVPVLKELNPNLLSAVSSLTISATQDNDLLEKIAEEKRNLLFRNGVYDKTSFLKLETPIQNRILLDMLRKNNLEIEKNRINCMKAILTKETGALNLSDNLLFKVEPNSFKLETKTENEEEFCVKIEVPRREGTYSYPVCRGKVVRLSIINNSVENRFLNIHKDDLKNYLNCDTIYTCVFRSRKNGDRISFRHRKVTKKLKKVFNEMHMTDFQKSRMVICEVDGKIAWCERLGADQFYLAEPSAQLLMKIEVEGD